MKSISKIGLAIAAIALACVVPLPAQYIGTVSPQTVQQTLATARACSGSAQTYAINNLGQTQHYLTISGLSGTSTSFQAEIDGIDVASNVVRISDQLWLNGQGLASPAVVSASGYFPKIQVVITCNSGSTYTATYSGASSTPNVQAGAYLTGSIDKLILDQSNAASGSQVLQTPFGNSSGTVYLEYTNASPTPSVTVQCQTTSAGANPVPIPISGNFAYNNLVLYPLHVASMACPFVKVNWSGVSAGTLTIEYLFAQPGTQSPPVDPCQSPNTVKSFYALSLAANTTSQIFPPEIGGGPGTIHVCGWQMSTAAAGTVETSYNS